MTSCPRTSRLPSRKVCLFAGAVALAALFAVTRHSSSFLAEPGKPPQRIPLYSQTQAAKNPERLTLVADGRKVIGWISGTTDYAGSEATVTVGTKTEKLRISEENSFAWEYQVEKNTRAEFTFRDHKQALTLTPREQLPSSVYFVVDRSVYRANQPLHFAAYLRRLDDRGEFVPLAKKTVEVELRRTAHFDDGEFDEQGRLRSQSKTTLANRWKLTSDDTGRITGSYTFIDADPLGDYELSIPEYAGSARLSLAEYRKSKLNLKITGEREGTRLKVRFQATDFLGQPLEATKVQFTAEIVRKPVLPARPALKGKEFVHAAPSLRQEELSEEEQLLARVEPDFTPVLGPVADVPPVVVAQVAADLKLTGKTAGEYTLEIPKSCQEPGHAVVVHGIVTDASGREQKKTQTIPLTFLSDKFKLNLPRTSFTPNEEIKVTARVEGGNLEGKATLVAMRLSPSPVPQWGFNGFGGQFGQFGLNIGALGQLGQIGQLGQFGFGGMGFPRQRFGRWQTIDLVEPVQRKLVTAAAFEGDTASLKLNEPGAYMLVAILERSDGSKMQQEIGCVVEPRHEQPGLALQLDRTSYKTGDTLTGAVHSRYADAVVFLTLRDSKGIRGWKPIHLKNGMAEIKETLPENLRYGCVVTVQYADSAKLSDPIHFASRSIHVEPTDRELTIETKMKQVYRPGDTVTVDVQVNRSEPVDLIVSVSDLALLAIKPSKAIDIRNFYLADERAFQTHARDLLQRRLGGITIDRLIKLAHRRLGKTKEDEENAEQAELNALIAADQNNHFHVTDMITLLKLAGVKAKFWQVRFGQVGGWARPEEQEKCPLMDLLNSKKDGWCVQVSLIGDTFYFTEYHPTEMPNPWPGYQPVARFGFNGAPQIGMFGMIGLQFGQIGQLGQIGQIGQLGAFGGMPGSRLLPAAQPTGPGEAPESNGPPSGLYVRQDFSDSAYWNARLRTDPNGKASFEFKVPDSYTNWKVMVIGVTKNMHVGQHQGSFSVAKPVMVSPIVPRLVTEGDTAQVGANIHNRTDKKQTLHLNLKVDNGKVVGPAELTRTLEPGQGDIVYWHFQAGGPGFTDLLMTGSCEGGSDAALKRLPVIRSSAEQVITISGYCKDQITLELPRGVDPKAANMEIRFAPTLAADLVDTLDYLVDYPYGCVEQTMSRFLPAIKVAQVLDQLKVEHAGLAKKLPHCVQGGIKRLLELQQPDGGWGWNGNSQTHEMMTPYALYGLLIAEKAGYTIGSEDAIQRGLARLKTFIDNLHRGQKKQKGQNGSAADRIYCIYVYAHRHNIEPAWWEFIEDEKDDLSDYALALALELAVKQKRLQTATLLADRLIQKAQVKNDMVYWTTAGFSRWGDDPHEITAMAFKALLAYDAKCKLIPGVLTYFNVTKHGNRWNSTKDTALIVQALCDYLEKQRIDPRTTPKLAFRCNDGPVTEVKFDDRAAMKKLAIPAELVKTGMNKITFTEASPGVVYRLVLRHWSTEREAEPASFGIDVEREYWLLDGKGKRVRQLKSGDEVPRGSFVESVVKAQQAGVNTMRYVLVENPRPSPCEVMAEDDKRFTQNSTTYVLREERQTHVAWHHEQTGNTLEDVCVLHAELAGDYLIPVARVELMYQTEVRGHSGTFRLRVVEKK
jgi:uncharacterized protein YfaS (alpha-2-macroglobulin family)